MTRSTHKLALAAVTALLSVCAWVGSVAAQTPEETGGLTVEVANPELVLFHMAVPDAINQGNVADTHGLTEALTGTIQRDLKLVGYFNLIDKAAYLVDPAKEGLEPDFRAWFNIGAQGLVKIAYRVVGTEVIVDMRLFSVDKAEQVKLASPYDTEVKLPLDAARVRMHAHGFANEVIRYYTQSPGFFLSRVVYAKRIGKAKELFMVAPDGNDEVQLTRNGSINMLPTYAQGKVFYTSFKEGNPSLYVLESGKSRRVSARHGLNTGGALSPDGTKLALTMSKDGNPEVYIINPGDGSVIKRLTNSWGIDTSPSWSPDGKQIAFVSDRHGSPQIWLMNADGSNQRRLTFQGDYNQTPDWSPRGDKIVFTARDERFKFDLFTVEVASGTLQRLTQGQGNNEEPSWSPDGRHIVFTSTRTGESKLYLMTADGRIQHMISRGKGEYVTPSWGR